MTGRRPDLRREAERRDILGKMIGRRLAIPGEGRIRRDRFDPQQGKQPLEAVVEIGIDAVEDRLKLRRVGHSLIFPWLAGVASACQVAARQPPETRSKQCSSEGGCRMCQTNPPAITAAAARLFP